MSTDFIALARTKASEVGTSLDFGATEMDSLLRGFDNCSTDRNSCVLVYPDDLAMQWAFDLGRILSARAHWKNN